MKSRAEIKFIQVFTDLHENLLTRGIKPAYMRLENESSTAFWGELKAKNIEFQVAPPEMHHRNAEKRAISAFKDNFIVGICSTDPDFLMKNWYRLVEQADITIHLFQP